MAFSGSPRAVQFNSNTVYIYDDHDDAVIGSLVFPRAVISASIQYEFLIVVLENETCVYHLKDLTLFRRIATYRNEKGIASIQLKNGMPIVCVLGESRGCIRLIDERRDYSIRAHESAISALCLSYNGEFAASASVRGSIIRVFDTTTGKCLSVIRRGHMRAGIVNIEFDRYSQYLMCNSDTTVHIAKRERLSDMSLGSPLPTIDEASEDGTQRMFGGVFSDSFSFRYSNPDHSKSMVAVFGSEPESVFVLTTNGLFVKLSIDADRGLVKYQESNIRSL